MYRYNEIQTIHLEITTACNASCPMCMRNIQGGPENPLIPKAELSLAQIKDYLPPETIRQLARIYLCGNFGDPAAAKETLEVLSYFRDCNPTIHLGMNSNGALRPTEWWRRAAVLLDYCRFSIDGLEDTNHIYRRGTQWNVLMRNVSAFIESGGAAHWDYLVFRHNEHQIEQAKALATELGFKAFQPKKTARFARHDESNANLLQVLKRDGSPDYVIEPPENPKFRNTAADTLFAKPALQRIHYFDKTPIDCKVAKEKSVYVSAEGLVFPCCWTAQKIYSTEDRPQLLRLLGPSAEDFDLLSLRKHSFSEIINGDFFQAALPRSWNGPTVAEGRPKVCARICGIGYDVFGEQFAESQRL